jgi:hypothetical protein
MKQLNEGLEYMDMKNHVTPILGIDEFESRIGEDSDIIVINFIVDSKKVATDLVDWLERGYQWIIDAEISPGEVLDKKYYVFAEMNRRSNAAERIMEVLDDLWTLTDIKQEGWQLKIDGKRYPASKETIQDHVELKPKEYERSKEAELNEWREIAGLNTVNSYEADEDIKNWQRQAGII